MTPERKRALLIAGALLVVIVAYLWLRGRSPGQSSAAQQPDANSAGGQAAGAGAQGGAEASAAADMLAALAGENQQLLASLLSSSNGLVSLAGSSVGSPSASQTVSEPSLSTSFAGFDTPTTTLSPAASTTSTPSYDYNGRTVSPVTYSSLGVTPDPITQSMVEPPLQQSAPQPTAKISESVSPTGVRTESVGDVPAGVLTQLGAAPDISAASAGPQLAYAETNPITVHKPGSGNLAA